MASKVLIYGGSGGIGSATARILHSRGYDLHLVGRSEERLSAIATECGANFTLGDLNDASLFSRAAKDAGESLDGLVYAVGTINLRSLQRLTEADFLNDFRVNAMGAALAIQAALPALKKSTGISFCGIVLQRGRPAGLYISCLNGNGEGGRGWFDFVTRGRIGSESARECHCTVPHTHTVGQEHPLQ